MHGSQLKISLIAQITRYLTNYQENFIQIIYKLKIKYLLVCVINYKISNIYIFSSNRTGCLQTVGVLKMYVQVYANGVNVTCFFNSGQQGVK